MSDSTSTDEEKVSGVSRSVEPGSQRAVSERRSEPNPLATVLLYIVIVFIAAAVAAPRFFATAQMLAEHFPVWRNVSEQPFHRFVGRSLLVFALVGLPLFVRALRIGSAAALGISVGRQSFWQGTQGLVWGFSALAFAVSLAVASGARTWDLNHSSAEITTHVRNSLLAAIAVSLIEELLFRGALFGSLRRRYSFIGAAILSSAIYAMLHFFQQPSSPGAVEWFSGFFTLGQMLRGFFDLGALVPGFFNIFIIGMMLALLFERTGSLLFSIGLHAALIFWLKTVGFVTRAGPAANAWIWGSSKLIDGWATTVVLVFTFLLLRAVVPARQSYHE